MLRRWRGRRASASMTIMQMRELPAGEMPRERLIEKGAQELTDAELLAILLRTGRRGENVLDMARRIISELPEQRISALLYMPAQELARIDGLGLAKAATVLAALELGSRAQRRAGARIRVDEAQVVADLLLPRYRTEIHEHFLVLPLTSKNDIIMEAEVSRGTLTRTLVHPREVFVPAIRCAAARGSLVHNHPSGDPMPSAEDHRITRILVEAGRLLSIPVVDHIVLGSEGYYSFAEHGLI